MVAKQERVVIDKRSTAYQSFEESAGLAGLPREARNHFEPANRSQNVAVAQNEVIGRVLTVVPENP